VVKRDDVARRAGVSSAVVSYVVNDGPRPVAAATRLRVLQAIEELGYRPNGVARALRSRRTWSVGLVVPDNSNPFFAQLAHAIEDEAFARGYALLLGNASGDPGREESYLRAFQERQVDALIVVTNGPTKDLPRIYEGTIPMVVIADNPIPGLAASVVKVDNTEGARLATEHLISHGHRRVACVLGPHGSAPALERFTGWQRAMRDARLRPSADLVRWADFDRVDGYHAAADLLSARHRPAAVFVASDHQAIGVLRAAADRGVRVPEDLAVIGFDGIAEADYTVPRLATVRQPVDAMARRAVELLLPEPATLEGVTETFAMTLVARGSCGCPDPAAESPLS
jgi:LacI family transcriptional regulator